MQWLGSHEPTVLFSLLLVVAGLWVFVAIADDVVEGAALPTDQRIINALRHPGDPRRPIGPAWLPEAARDITALGGVVTLSLVTFVTAGFLWLNGKRGTARVLLLAVCSGAVLTFWLKELFDRPRPAAELHLTEVATASFPSGHSMMSAVVYLTLGSLLAATFSQWRLRVYVVGVTLMLTLLIGLSRVYLGVHYPSDVLAGWAAGLAWAVLCRLLLRRLAHRGRVEAPPSEP